MKPIRKAVMPVAGLGTRVLPATKSIPKEMLTVVDRPLIEYNIAEARAAGIEHFIFVTGRGKNAIEDYFDRAYELEDTLEQKGKTELLAELQRLTPAPGEVSYTRQQSPLGLGHAIWCARHLVGDEPFAILLPDEIVEGGDGYIKQMVQAYEKTGGNIIAVEEIPQEDTSKYGVIAPKGRDGNLIPMSGMVEKPAPEDAPSNLRVIGRYILQPEIFDLLAKQGKGAGGEIQLTDAMASLLKDQDFYGCLCDGNIHDCGSKVGWLKANIAFALQREDMKDRVIEVLGEALKDQK